MDFSPSSLIASQIFFCGLRHTFVKAIKRREKKKSFNYILLRYSLKSKQKCEHGLLNFFASEKNLPIKPSIYLIFVKLAVFVGRLSLLLEGNNDKTDEDVHHEEGDDNDVYEIKHSNYGPEVMDGSNVLSIGIDWNVKDARPTFKGWDHKQG